MLIRQQPKDDSKYIKIFDSVINQKIQQIGIMPLYYSNGIFYYQQNDKLLKFINTCKSI